ncbi:MAG: hypothetical protein Q8922_10330 [Bacteroidota bacterium]|nr:hypothetical protein [Bacteroidota bacterium]MDP4233907.1 hypothetical protein [Bacteroidota bacterium]MDP4242843.1 hypothetical protein [Bacteroidota bacterium]MDP4288321.1 hypothetical protein [Bacteroidota bacterium]
MKLLLSIVIVTTAIGVSVRPVTAQPKVYVPAKYARDTSTFWIFNDITMGPYFTAGYARQNEKLPDGWHSMAQFAYTFGGTIDGAINSWLGLNFSLLYDSRDVSMATSGDSDNIDLNIGYIAIQPSLRIFWLLVGLAFDLPMSGSANEAVAVFTNPRTNTTGKYAGNLNANTSDLATLTELRATLSIPILHAESGMLHLIVSGNYPLGHTVTGTSSFDTTGHFSKVGAGPLPTVEAGLTYQFDLLH